MNPALVDDQAPVSAELTGFCGGAVMRPQPDRAEQVNESAFIRDMWSALARASTDNAPRTLAAARDAVFGRYLPMARTLAITPGQGRRPATGDHRAGPEGVLPTTRWVQRQGKPAHRGVRSTEGRR